VSEEVLVALIKALDRRVYELEHKNLSNWESGGSDGKTSRVKVFEDGDVLVYRKFVGGEVKTYG